MYKQSIGKECSVCHQLQGLDQYYKRTQSKDGYAYNCKSCQRDIVRRFHEKNPNKHSEYNMRYKAKDPKRVAILEREQRIKYRRKQGAKPNSRSRGRVPYKDLEVLEMSREREKEHQKKVRAGVISPQKRLELKPLKGWIEEKLEQFTLMELANLTNTSTSNLKIVLEESKPYTYDTFVDRLLTEMGEPWRYEELYPDK